MSFADFGKTATNKESIDPFGLHMISRRRLSNVSDISSSKGTKSIAGARDSVSIENLNDLILHQPDCTDVYKQYDGAKLVVMEIEPGTDSLQLQPTACATEPESERTDITTATTKPDIGEIKQQDGSKVSLEIEKF